MLLDIELNSTELSNDKLHSVTQRLRRALDEERGVSADLKRAATGEGDKGAAVAIGAIVMEVLKASGTAAIIEVLGNFLTREKSLKGTITFPDGRKVELTTTNLETDEFHRALNLMAADGAVDPSQS